MPCTKENQNGRANIQAVGLGENSKLKYVNKLSRKWNINLIFNVIQQNLSIKCEIQCEWESSTTFINYDTYTHIVVISSYILYSFCMKYSHREKRVRGEELPNPKNKYDVIKIAENEGMKTRERADALVVS